MRAEQKISLIRPPECANGRMRAMSSGGSVDVEIEADPVTGTRQWFRFRLQASPGVIVRIVNAGMCTYPGGWPSSLIWTRSRGALWRPLKFSFEDGVVTFVHGAAGATAEYALFPPYSLHRLKRLVEQAKTRADVNVIEPDGSLGRALRLSFGDRDAGARQIWVIAGQHGGEHPAFWFVDGFLRALLRRKRPIPGIRFHIVPVANPRGMHAGHLRTNAAGQDPNRFWATPETCQEVASLHDAMATAGVDTLLDIHTDFEMGCVYLDVLDEWMQTPAPLVTERERFERSLSNASPDVEYGKRYPWKAPPDTSLLAGMCAPAVERRFGATAITLELPIGRYGMANGAWSAWTPRHSQSLGRVAAGAFMQVL